MTAWLWRSIVATAGAVLIISALQWGTCRFYVLPSALPWYTTIGGSLKPDKTAPDIIGCNDVDARTITVMMSVLTTLISLSRNAE
jgi:hypothetical protein